MGHNATATARALANSIAANRGIVAQRAREAARQAPQQPPVMQPSSPLPHRPVQPVKAPARPAYAGSYTLDSRAIHWGVGVLVGMAFLSGSLIGGILAHASKSTAAPATTTSYSSTTLGSVRQPTGVELESLRLAVTAVGKGWCALEWHATDSNYQTVCHSAAQ